LPQRTQLPAVHREAAEDAAEDDHDANNQIH
jgi:hypothetical protein